jgi:multicomponent Na+:H+ antiporter subunit C
VIETQSILPGLFNYWVAMALLVIGLVITLDSRNMIKKLVGLGIFQSAVFLLFITIGKVSGGTAPILDSGIQSYSNPLPHVLILTAIVVGVATTAVGLALAIRIRQAYGTVHEDEIDDKPDVEPEIIP